MNENRMESIYREIPHEEIPWNVETPPELLVQLVESGKVKPCRAIDLGCGVGNYAIYLATKGFDVTGIDISPTAIKTAKKKAREKGVRCNFLVGDVLGDIDKVVYETFQFAYDWELLHHIFPDKRRGYVENVHRIVEPRGKYLSVCFSEQDNSFGGTGKYRKTPLGTVLYFSSREELKNLFQPYFRITKLKEIEIQSRFSKHLAHYVLMERK